MSDASTNCSFVHLRAHSEFSLIDGMLRVKPYIKKLVEYGVSAVTLTDNVNLFALVKMYRAALDQGVKPLIAADLILREGDECSLFSAYCQNEQGYKNLTQLISIAYLKGQVLDNITVTWEEVQAYSDGLLIVSGGRRGDIGKALIANQTAQAKQCLERWKVLFPDRFYLELQRTGREHESVYNHAAVELAHEYNIPVVATNDVCFLSRDDFEAHEARVCIASGRVLDDPQRPKQYSEQQYLRSPEEMQDLFSDIPEALANTVEIVKRCNAMLTLGKPCLPQFPIPEDQTLESFFRAEAEQGLKERLSHIDNVSDEQLKEYQQRLDHELGVIIRMGFPGYFLIVADFIRWAKENNIPVGPGRGSGAGSLVAYVLHITDLDPLEHELLFERFLNPERVSMPDFDVDFCMEQRDLVIDYVAKRYGREAVSQIITYGTMAAKAVVRDVGRVLSMPYGFVDKIAKLIPFELGITLDKALVQEAQLAERYREEAEVTTLIDLARKLEGVTRNAGKHAGGVVISPTKLIDFSPLYCEADGSNPVTQFDKDDVEAVGLVKFDFLGLRTLTIIDWALQKVNKRRQKNGEQPIDISKLPLNDSKSFELLKNCETSAVFQLESRGMKDLIRRLQPDNFDEITALVALFRPGPLQSGMVDDFIDRKHGRAIVTYPHPDLEPILKPTYGVILYQEQVMQIAQVLANYSLGGADILRRAMGKKKPEEMAKQRQIFTDGAVGRGVDANLAEQIFDLMEKFAGYGFNKSHSAAYALVAYQTAWLKAHYPAEFMAAVLSSDMDNTDKVVGFIDECQRMKLQITPPNINQGFYQFTVNDEGKIVYGLGAIKGAGQAAIEYLVEEREAHGRYHDLFEFCDRVDTHKVNRRVLDPLIRSGAMDEFEHNRATLLASINNALKHADQLAKDAQVGQESLFGGGDDVHAQPKQYRITDMADQPTRLRGEKETLGIYISGHPMQAYEEDMRKFTSTPLNGLSSFRQKNATVGGMLLSVRPIITKSGRRMAVIVIEDRTSRMEITLFSRLFDEMREQLEIDKVYIIKGKVEDDDFTGGVRMIAESIKLVDEVREQFIKRIVLRVHDQQQVDQLLEQLPEITKPYRNGHCPISISYQSNDAKAELMLGSNWRVKPKAEFIDQLYALWGESDVAVKY